MAVLKTYSITSDITSGVINETALSEDIEASGTVTGFDGVSTKGDDVMILGTAISDETALDLILTNHTGVANEVILKSLFPRMSTSERTTQVEVEGGVIVFDTTLDKYYKHDGTSWSLL